MVMVVVSGLVVGGRARPCLIVVIVVVFRWW